ncbi:MAG: DNA-directed RNA polymerase subunit L [Methanomicrobiales archaeon]|nr:DNA-directed RNA polymerase subunit L [Methanomicrobiales archaeon]MDI6875973.1 DNA-directed RNA polymerase subunit L [Methanomicrobiales archaeon]
MEIKVLELNENRARILFVGEGHTFMNLLASEILKDPEVDVARYRMEYQFSDPELLVTTRGSRNPVSAIRDACSRIAAECDDLLAELP